MFASASGRRWEGGGGRKLGRGAGGNGGRGSLLSVTPEEGGGKRRCGGGGRKGGRGRVAMLLTVGTAACSVVEGNRGRGGDRR